jgi:peptide/nickel transport system substrate-binding protein
VIFEAFKSGAISTHRESNAGRWDSNYSFPAAKAGEITKSEVAHQRPTGIKGFVFNTRRELFADWQVRQALIFAFNNEFINKTVNGSLQPKVTSYFSNSVLGMDAGPATGRVLELLEPFKEDLLPGTLEGYEFPISDGAERNRPNLRRASKMLAAAGWQVGDDGVLRNAAGTAFTFDILLNSGSAENEAIANIYVDALSRLGIEASITVVDSAQYKERASVYDFDMTYYRRGVSLSPGNEQMLYWGSKGVTEPGTRNYMGMNSPAAEAMIQKMLSSDSQEEFRAAVKALDRILTASRYVVPFWHSDISRIAHKSELHFPDKIPMYGDWLGFLPDVWWVE